MTRRPDQRRSLPSVTERRHRPGRNPLIDHDSTLGHVPSGNADDAPVVRTHNPHRIRRGTS
ncbi:hypothetical protein QTQ03_06790 [Micromonospora sp. WMMA1363]|uniref:hypothetical protein n=1 Tax=Micromonospora sp. WMMA1363 TaxID=3053985 RepID=UPI00259C8682|nr:hypothetical protein [Micromonospora sp. WMMA1363]MDM4719317.1 hypothetical protein [Micromonospora sp. WMMA1363]